MDLLKRITVGNRTYSKVAEKFEYLSRTKTVNLPFKSSIKTAFLPHVK